jgi:secondary thiamine-phosphate synthase enzyme
MHIVTVTTQRAEHIVDITDVLHEELKKQEMKDGVLHLFVQHTTASLTVMDLDPGTDLDMLDAMEAIFPALHYRHPHDPSHVGDHVWSAIVGPSLAVPFVKKKLLLGTWQRVVVVELDGPRERKVVLSFLREG